MRIIYRISFPLYNTKCYIGQTNNPKRRWRDHKKAAIDDCSYLLHRALRCHGIENAVFEVIATCLEDTDDCGNAAEVSMVSQYESFGPRGYNMTPGGLLRSG